MSGFSGHLSASGDRTPVALDATDQYLAGLAAEVGQPSAGDRSRARCTVPARKALALSQEFGNDRPVGTGCAQRGSSSRFTVMRVGA